MAELKSTGDEIL